MTREEAIAYGESKKARIQEKLIRVGSAYGDYAIYYSEMAFTSAAISALREQEERDNRIESDSVKNEPLTMEELLKMDGEPVWVVCAIGEESMWFIVDLEECELKNPWDSIPLDYWNDGYPYSAYRSKPKEDA